MEEENGKVSSSGFRNGSAGTQRLQHAGWTRNTMQIGDEVIVEGSRLAKDGTKQGNARSVTMAATGKKLGGASSEAQHSVATHACLIFCGFAG